MTNKYIHSKISEYRQYIKKQYKTIFDTLV